MQRYLFITIDDIEPGIEGPYETDEARDDAALRIRLERGPDHGIFGLDLNGESDDGYPQTWAYSGGFFEPAHAAEFHELSWDEWKALTDFDRKRLMEMYEQGTNIMSEED